MFAKKTIMAAAALAALTAAGIGGADAQSMHRSPVTIRHQVRPMELMTVSHARVLQTLRMHRLVALSDPYFFHGRYVVRSHDRFGRVVLVQIDPWTGSFIGVVRI